MLYGRFCFLYRFFLYDMNIFIYGIIFRDMGDLEDIWEILNVIWEILNILLLTLFLIFFFYSLSCKTQSWQDH